MILLLLLLFTSIGIAQPVETCNADDTRALRQSGQQALQKRQYDAAVEQFQRALDACPTQRGILLEISQAQSHRKQFAEAIAAARQFLAQEPTSLKGRLALADAYFMAQRFAEAREQADQILKQDPHNPEALKLKGNVQYLMGDFEHAQDTFIDLLDGHSDDEEAAYMLGRIYYQEGRIDYAMGQFQRVLKINPRSYKAYDNLGLCYQARGENETATRHFLTAIKLVEKDHPEYDWPYANLGNLLLDSGDAEKAFAAASKAADRNPYSARNFYIGGKALCKLEKTDLCINWLERSVSIDANYAEPLYLLSKVYAQSGQDQKAKQALEKFREVKAREPAIKR